MQSAIVSCVVGAHSGGINIAALVADLQCSLSRQPEADEIEAALADLVAERLVRVQNGRVYPGAVFGSGSGASVGPGNN